MNRANDEANASIASALVRAGLQFHTLVGQGADGELTRLFQAFFDLPGTAPMPGAKYSVTMYVGGAALTAVAPIKISGGTAKRHEVTDHIMGSMPLIRVLPHVAAENPEQISWIEASAPMPTSHPTLDPETPTMLFMAVASAVVNIVSRFPADTSVTLTAQAPIFTSAKEIVAQAASTPAPARVG